MRSGCCVRGLSRALRSQTFTNPNQTFLVGVAKVAIRSAFKLGILWAVWFSQAIGSDRLGLRKLTVTEDQIDQFHQVGKLIAIRI